MSLRGLQGRQLKSVPMSSQRLLLCYCLQQAISYHHLLFNPVCHNTQWRQHVFLSATGLWPRSATAHVNQMQKIYNGPGRTGCWQIKHVIQLGLDCPSCASVLTKVSTFLQIVTVGIFSSFDSLDRFQVLCDPNHVASCILKVCHNPVNTSHTEQNCQEASAPHQQDLNIRTSGLL